MIGCHLSTVGGRTSLADICLLWQDILDWLSYVYFARTYMIGCHMYTL